MVMSRRQKEVEPTSSDDASRYCMYVWHKVKQVCLSWQDGLGLEFASDSESWGAFEHGSDGHQSRASTTIPQSISDKVSYYS